MLIVCGELYGTILYFYTSWHEGSKLQGTFLFISFAILLPDCVLLGVGLNSLCVWFYRFHIPKERTTILVVLFCVYELLVDHVPNPHYLLSF